jgi:formate hydrogenlyase subunit 3/multisubunit Na+/H+ antiporter MnhD subunit
MTVSPLVAVWLPALFAPLVLIRGRLGRAAMVLAPWSALPALALSLPPPPAPRIYPAILLGTRLGADLVGQVFLLFSALLWIAAGVYAHAYFRDGDARRRFFFPFLLSMAGNLVLILAGDAVTFFFGFALMTFAAYGLVVHAGTTEALRAGRVYIVLAVLGEAALLAGLLLAAAGATDLAPASIRFALAGAPARSTAMALLVVGFGIKAGAVPLHVWLPLAHPVAPTPASAVLSGVMIKAGLLGWLRFLPIGEVALPGWGSLFVILGFGAAFLAVAIGLTQTDAKTALAYSSVSQMGLVGLAVGLGLHQTVEAPAAQVAALAYAAHHGLAKGALFLGVGVVAAAGQTRWPRRLGLLGCGFAALAVAGAPLTSGSLAKSYLKAAAAPIETELALDFLLPVAAVGTTLLMGRFLSLLSPSEGTDHRPPLSPGLWVPWALILVVLGVVLYWLPHSYPLGVEPPRPLYPTTLLVSFWPVLAGVLLLWTAVLIARRRPPRRPLVILPGDLLALLSWAHERLRPRLVPQRRAGLTRTHPAVRLADRWSGLIAEHQALSLPVRLERTLTRFGLAAALFFFLLLAVYALTKGAPVGGGGP